VKRFAQPIYKEAWRDRLYEALATLPILSGKGANS